MVTSRLYQVKWLILGFALGVTFLSFIQPKIYRTAFYSFFCGAYGLDAVQVLDPKSKQEYRCAKIEFKDVSFEDILQNLREGLERNRQ